MPEEEQDKEEDGHPRHRRDDQRAETRSSIRTCNPISKIRNQLVEGGSEFQGKDFFMDQRDSTPEFDEGSRGSALRAMLSFQSSSTSSFSSIGGPWGRRKIQVQCKKGYSLGTE